MSSKAFGTTDISTSTFISVLQNFNDFVTSMNGRTKCLGVTATPWTTICDTIVPMTLPRNWELSTDRSVSQRCSDNTDLESKRLELGERSIDLHTIHYIGPYLN
jgi:hypothetical protein